MNKYMKKIIVAMLFTVIFTWFGMLAMATTYDLTQGGPKAARSGSEPTPFILSRVVSCEETNYAGSDVLNMINISSGQVVRCVTVHVTTAEDSTGVIDVGDGADPDGYIVDMQTSNDVWQSSAELTASSVATFSTTTNSLLSTNEVILTNIVATITPSVSPAFAYGKYYNSNDVIKITFASAMTKAVIIVHAEILDFNRQP